MTAAGPPILVLPDTNVFAAYLGRGDRPLRDALDRLIRARRVRVAPPVRFEVSRGIRRQPQFDYVRGLLTAFGGAELRASDWDGAAGLARAAAGSPGKHRVQMADLLLATVAARLGAAVWSRDPDFRDRLGPHVPALGLYHP